jgi:hypothetical protein
MAVSLVSTGVQFPDSTIQTTASGASGLNLVTTVTASGAANVQIENAMTAYDRYVITFDGVKSSASPGSLYVRLKVGGGYQGSAYYYGVVGQFYSGSASTTYTRGHPAGYIPLAESAYDTGTNYDLSGNMYLAKPSSSVQKKIWGEIVYTFNGGANTRFGVFGGGYEDTPVGTLTGVEFYTGGTITGTFRLYGYAK